MACASAREPTLLAYPDSVDATAQRLRLRGRAVSFVRPRVALDELATGKDFRTHYCRHRPDTPTHIRRTSARWISGRHSQRLGMASWMAVESGQLAGAAATSDIQLPI